MSETAVIAIPSKGRLMEKSEELFAAAYARVHTISTVIPIPPSELRLRAPLAGNAELLG